MKKFVINQQNKMQVISNINSYLSFLEISVDVEVMVKPYKKNRSRDQNAYYWVLVSAITKETGHTKDDIHDMLAYKFLGMREKKVGSKTISFIPSTTRLKVGEMADYITQCEQWAAQLGILLPYKEF